jgi:predicted lactoylglutathione lyase
MTLDHIGIPVSDFEKAKEFYAKALAPLGYSLAMDMAEWKAAGFMCDGKQDFWLGGNDVAHKGTHIAFAAKNKETVDAFYNAALAAGGRDNGAPGYRKEYSPGYYGAFIIDMDGHNLEAVFHDPDVT